MQLQVHHATLISIILKWGRRYRKSK